MDQNEFPLGPRHIGVPLVAPKMFYEPIVRSVQIERICCVKINTISKKSETSFHLIYVT
jgi:hypothetical protein